MTQDARRVSLLLGVLFGLTGMGSSSASVALPAMAEGLGVSIGVGAWTISLYALFLAVTTALYGRVSDLVGIRAPMLVGIGLMAVGALVAALAPSYEVLLVARIVQGAGAAAVPTLGVALLSHRFEGAVRGAALARLAGLAAAVTSLGPLLGGIVESTLGWRAAMALPIMGVLVIPLLWSHLQTEGTGARLDLIGAVLVAAASSGLVLLVQSPSTGGAVAVTGLVLVVLGVPAVALWVTRRPHGFLPLVVIKNATVVRFAVAASAVPAAWFGMLVAIPAALVSRGWESWHVGLILLPASVVGLFAPRITAPLLERHGATIALRISAGLAAVAAVIGGLGVHLANFAILAVAIVLVSVAFGIGQPSMTAAVGEAVELPVRGVALGVATLLFLVGGSVGSAVVGGMGEVVGLPWALAIVALLPVVGVVVLGRRPEVQAR